MADQRHIVIIGGGIIGSSTAYYLTRHPKYNKSHHRITILEASQIASGASGKAGGLLALWAYPKPIVPLSFNLHAQLAAEHDGASRWGYRRLHVGQLNAVAQTPAPSSNGNKAVHPPNEIDRVSLEKRSVEAEGEAGAGAARLRKAGIPSDLNWVSSSAVQSYESMGSTDDTAQVHPYLFTTSMASLAREAGATVLFGRATSIDSADGKVSGVTYVDKTTSAPQTLAATDVVVCAGPWTATLLPRAPIAALRAHSVTIRTQQPVSAYALFTDITIRGGKRREDNVTPEIYARPDGEVYACGEGDRLVPLPSSTEDVATDESRCQAIIDQVGSISEELRNGKVTVRQACYLPNVEGKRQGPFMGRTQTDGLFVAMGHTCWGIQNGPGTGKVMSEVVFDGEGRSADVRSLDPRLVL